MDHHQKVFSSYKEKDFKTCLKLITEAQDEFRDSTHYKVLKATCLVNLGEKLDEAHQLYSEILEADEKNAYAHYGMGLAYHHQKNFIRAISSFDKAIENGAPGSMVMAQEMKDKAMRTMLEVGFNIVDKGAASGGGDERKWTKDGNAKLAKGPVKVLKVDEAEAEKKSTEKVKRKENPSAGQVEDEERKRGGDKTKVKERSSSDGKVVGVEQAEKVGQDQKSRGVSQAEITSNNHSSDTTVVRHANQNDAKRKKDGKEISNQVEVDAKRRSVGQVETADKSSVTRKADKQKGSDVKKMNEEKRREWLELFKYTESTPKIKPPSNRSGNISIIEKIPKSPLKSPLIAKSKPPVINKDTVTESSITVDLRTCKVCSRVFTKPFSLTRHMALHTGERPHKCEECSFAFVQKSDLVRHVATHSPEYNFECTQCKKVFKTKKNLQCHKASHSASTDRAFKCRFCPKTFTLGKLLTFHENIHNSTNPFKCDSCDKQFSAKYQVKLHMKQHINDKPFGCNLCGITFSNIARFGEHFRDIHGVGKKTPSI